MKFYNTALPHLVFCKIMFNHNILLLSLIHLKHVLNHFLKSFYFSVYNRLTCVTKLRILIENGHVHIFNIIEYTRIYMYMIGLDSDMLTSF